MTAQEKALDVLRELQIPHTYLQHTAVYTIEEMLSLGLHEGAEIAKNLFLRDAKGRRFFLVMQMGHKRADLLALQAQLGCTRLSFASEDRLMQYLGLSKGSVTPLGILNDTERRVEVVLDRDLCGLPRIGLHPNDNTATVFLAFDDLAHIVEWHQNSVTYVQI